LPDDGLDASSSPFFHPYIVQPEAASSEIHTVFARQAATSGFEDPAGSEAAFPADPAGSEAAFPADPAYRPMVKIKVLPLPIPVALPLQAFLFLISSPIFAFKKIIF
jgi:hypothetical protein